jgi:hypothetical protein
MRLRLSRRARLLAAAASVAVLTAVFAFGPCVRTIVRAAAAKRHIAVDIRSVRPGWYAVRLLGVEVRPESVSALRIAADELRVDLSIWLRPSQLEFRGVVVEATGDEEHLHDELIAWRALRRAEAPGADDSSKRPVVLVNGMALRWYDGTSNVPRAELVDLSALFNTNGIRVRAPVARVRAGSAEVSATDATADLDPAGTVIRAHASSIVVTVAALGEKPQPEHTNVVALPPSSVPATAADPGAPLLPVPDLMHLRSQLAILAAALADRVVVDADIGVDALTWKVERVLDQVPFTLGPGPLAVTRSASAFELRFSTDAREASTPLAVRIVLPNAGDAAVSLEGGPISLSLLGIKEGAAGLVDVANATVTGKARAVLAEDGSALTFDGEAGARGLSLSNPRLARDVVRGLDLQIHARGAATSEGELRLDDLAASLGAVHIAAGGALDQRPDHVAGAFHFEIPTASCQSLLDSLPSALLPALQGTRIAGNFGARGRFGFDTRSLDSLELEYDVKDQCHVTQVPPELARERFQQSFTHRIYLPDGSIADELTGPGTDNWTPLDEISPYMQVAVLTTEDGGFPRHHGFNRASIRSSLVANLKARRFARGASTITMQLAKNLFLSRDKTLSRKLEEVVLTEYLEQTFSKDELMELYLNVIEFGPAVYGITSAAEHYFGRSPAELHLGECLFLSSLLPAPLRYSPMRESGQVPESWMRTLRMLMRVAHHYGRITDNELAEAEKEPIVFWRGGERPPPRPPVRARQGFDGESEDVNTASPLDAPVSP